MNNTPLYKIGENIVYTRTRPAIKGIVKKIIPIEQTSSRTIFKYVLVDRKKDGTSTGTVISSDAGEQEVSTPKFYPGDKVILRNEIGIVQAFFPVMRGVFGFSKDYQYRIVAMDETGNATNQVIGLIVPESWLKLA